MEEEMELEPMNPREMTPEEIKKAVQDVVRGSLSLLDAKERVTRAFTTNPAVWVNPLKAREVKVSLVPYPGAGLIEIECSR